MKKLVAAVVAVLSLIAWSSGMWSAHAQNAYKCYGDPVCQAKRDGRSVEEAKQRQNLLNKCARSAGISANAWAAHTVPAGPKADRMRACMGTRSP